jgi:hypothetical protein
MLGCNRTLVFLGASASAEFFADIALCPMEAIKVRMQTTLVQTILSSTLEGVAQERGRPAEEDAAQAFFGENCSNI